LKHLLENCSRPSPTLSMLNSQRTARGKFEDTRAMLRLHLNGRSHFASLSHARQPRTRLVACRLAPLPPQ
jgi:hypothetical protein